MPFAVEQWDMSEYDLVISSSYAVAKGFISHPDQLHISYVIEPMEVHSLFVLIMEQLFLNIKFLKIRVLVLQQ